MSEAFVRRATEDETAAYARRRAGSDADAALYLFLAERAGGAFVALDEQTPIGIALATRGSDELTVHDLYVEPSFRSQGIGRALLDALAQGDELSRSGVLSVDSSDAIAFALKHGVTPQMPLMRAAGAIPRVDDLLRLAANDYRFVVRDVDVEANGYALDALDRETRGCERRSDHAYFAGESAGMAFYLHDEFVGYAYVWPSGHIGPIAASSAAYVGAFLAFAMTASVRTYGASWCSVLLPAANFRAARTALRAGLRIESQSIFATDRATHDFTRYLGHGALLF
jgi:GNAT superfamily N-acetyltransferase